MDMLKSVKSKGYAKSSLRAVLKIGKHKLRLKQCLYDHTVFNGPQKYSEDLKSDKNYI